MLLSDRDIKAEIGSGRVKLDPYAPDLIQPSSIDVRLDRYFRVFENHRYPHIDPSIEQPDLTRLVETDGEDPFVLHPGEFVLASTYEIVSLPDDIAGRLRGQELARKARAPDALDSGLDRPRLLGPCDAGTVERRHAPHKAVAGDEDRAAMPVPDQFPRGTPVRLHPLRLALPRPARPYPVSFISKLLPRESLILAAGYSRPRQLTLSLRRICPSLLARGNPATYEGNTVASRLPGSRNRGQ